MSELELRVRSALHDAAERLPEEGTIRATQPRRERSVVVGAMTALAVLVVMLPVALFFTGQQPEPPMGGFAGLEVRFDLTQAEFLDASPYQRSILDDGVITVDEIRRAMTDHVWCIQESGFPDVQAWIELDGSSAMYMGKDGVDASMEGHFDGVALVCGTEYLEPLRGFYAELYRTQRYLLPRLPPILPEMVRTCLTGKGVHLAPFPDDTEGWTVTADSLGSVRASDVAWKALEECDPVLRRASITSYRVPDRPEDD